MSALLKWEGENDKSLFIGRASPQQFHLDYVSAERSLMKKRGLNRRFCVNLHYFRRDSQHTRQIPLLIVK